MKRTIVLLIVAAALASGAFAQPAPKAFDIFIDQKLGLESVPNLELNGFTTNYAFSDAGKGFMLLYLVLPESENAIEYDSESIYLLMKALLSHVAGRNVESGQVTRYPKDEVAALTNGDFGISAFVSNPGEEPGGLLSYELINVFYKRDYGSVCQVVAAKKLDFFKSGTYVSALQSFKFPGIKNK